jgi:hypothetical protein
VTSFTTTIYKEERRREKSIGIILSAVRDGNFEK